MNRRPSRGGSGPAKRSLAQRPRPHTLDGYVLPQLRGEPLIGGLADPIRVAGASDLLVVEREHFTHQTAGRTPIFPPLTLSA